MTGQIKLIVVVGQRHECFVIGSFDAGGVQAWQGEGIKEEGSGGLKPVQVQQKSPAPKWRGLFVRYICGL